MTVGERTSSGSGRGAVTLFVLRNLRADRRRVAGFAAGIFAFVALTVAATRLVGVTVRHAGTGAGIDVLGLDLLAILAVQMMAIGVRWVSDRAHNRHAGMARAAIIASSFAKVQAFSTAWHADTFAGSTARKIARAAQAYDVLIGCIYFNFLPTILLVLVLAGTIALESAFASAAMLAGSIAYFGIIAHYNRVRVMPPMKAAFARDSKFMGELVDVLANNAAVKAWATEGLEEASLYRHARDCSDRLVVGWNSATKSDQLQSAISAFILVLPIGITVMQQRFGAVDAGAVAIVVAGGFMLRGWLGAIGRSVRDAQNAVSEMSEMVELLGHAGEAERDTGLRRLNAERGRIRFEQVGFHYDDARVAIFEDLTLDIAPGQTVALVGPSGAGKSTFVRLLLGLYRPQKGRILIDGQDVVCCTRASVRQAIALVPQEPVLFHRTVGENLAYGSPGSTSCQIHDAAQRARLDAMIRTLPQGYETLVGERGVKLSGGERQRVAIARALIASRPVLVFDEATSSLDMTNERAIQEALREAVVGRTTIIVAHRLSTIRRADRILVFDRGRIVEDGTHADLGKRPGGHYARLLGADWAQTGVEGPTARQSALPDLTGRTETAASLRRRDGHNSPHASIPGSIDA